MGEQGGLFPDDDVGKRPAAKCAICGGGITYARKRRSGLCRDCLDGLELYPDADGRCPGCGQPHPDAEPDEREREDPERVRRQALLALRKLREKFPPYQPDSGPSKETARRIAEHAPRQRERVLVYFVAGLEEGERATDEQVSQDLDMNWSSAMARRNELMNAGLVRDSGERTETDREGVATLWEATPLARQAWEEL